VSVNAFKEVGEYIVSAASTSRVIEGSEGIRRGVVMGFQGPEIKDRVILRWARSSWKARRSSGVTSRSPSLSWTVAVEPDPESDGGAGAKEDGEF